MILNSTLLYDRLKKVGLDFKCDILFLFQVNKVSTSSIRDEMTTMLSNSTLVGSASTTMNNKHLTTSIEGAAYPCGTPWQ